MTVFLRRIISSFSQDIFFAANQGKVLTPKSVILPMLIKSLTNNTELITTISRLGHGVSYTKLSEITTEVAYSRINKNDGTVFLPQQCTKGTFTILVEDNIDRNEETLTGEHYSLFPASHTILCEPSQKLANSGK